MPSKQSRSAAGLLATPGAGKLVIDFSSIHPNANRTITARLSGANGMGWIDAPVSDGSKGAEQGTLAAIAAGDAAEIERVRLHVMAMARRLTHMGPTGAGKPRNCAIRRALDAPLPRLLLAARLHQAQETRCVDPCNDYSSGVLENPGKAACIAPPVSEPRRNCAFPNE
jgi:hypothetical protein